MAPRQSSISKTITGVAAGDLIRVVVAYYNSGASRTITVSDGTSYTSAITAYFDGSDDQYGIQEFYLQNAGSGSHTVVATFSASTTYQYIYIQERSGIATTGALNIGGTVLNSAPASGANSILSNAITTTATADVCGFTVDDNGVAPAITTGTTLSWTGRTGNPWTTQGSTGLMASEDLSAQAAGGYTATFGISSSGGRYLTYVVAYNTTGSCTHDFWSSSSAFAVPNGSSGSYWSTASGAFATPNCSTGTYWLSTGAKGST